MYVLHYQPQANHMLTNRIICKKGIDENNNGIIVYDKKRVFKL